MATFDDQWLSRALLEAGVGVWSLDVTQGVVRPHGDWWPAPNGPARTRALTLADCGQYVHDSERGSVFSAISALVEGSVTQARLEFRLRLQSAEWRWYDCRAHAPTRDANGRATMVVGTLVDCHEAVVSRELPESLERRLRETQARFHSFVANTRDAVWCYEFDPPISLALPVHEQFERVLEGRLVECNQAYVDMRGASSVEDFIGQRVRSIHRSSLDSLRQLYLRMVEHHFVLEDSRLEQDPASGGPRYVTVRAQGIRAGPTLTRIWGSFADVTAKLQADRDREALEAQLRQSQKMESIGTLTGGMAHDFNNVLAAISAEADLGLYAVGSGDLNELRESLTLIKKSADRGATLTRRLLTFARRHTTPRRVTRLDLLLHELWPMLRRLISESISLKLETPEALWALVDPSQLEQVVVNLVVNARDAIGERGGEIVVSCVPATVGPEATRAKTWVTAGRFVRLSVADNGAGISPTLHDRVFEPFFTTKRLGEGTGLGLSMVYSILKQHDGFVELESNEGQGARFDAFLPRAEPPSDAPPRCNISKNTPM